MSLGLIDTDRISDEYEKAEPINQHSAFSQRTVVQQIDVPIPPAAVPSAYWTPFKLN